MHKFLSILLILFIVSCNKKQNIQITAINPVTGEPCAGLRFTPFEEKPRLFNEEQKNVFVVNKLS